jgi:hypothetical protein
LPGAGAGALGTVGALGADGRGVGYGLITWSVMNQGPTVGGCKQSCPAPLREGPLGRLTCTASRRRPARPPAFPPASPTAGLPDRRSPRPPAGRSALAQLEAPVVLTSPDFPPGPRPAFALDLGDDLGAGGGDDQVGSIEDARDLSFR